MPFCPNCGQEVTSSMQFCPNCGSALSAAAVSPVVASPVVSTPVRSYRVIVLERNTCTKKDAVALLRDLLGYTVTMATNLVNMIPTEVAQGLTLQQAVYVAQALDEYELSVAVCDNAGQYVDITPNATRSIYNTDGSFIQDALTVFGTLSLANRVANAARWSRPNPATYRYRRTYSRRRPTLTELTLRSLFGLRPAPARPAPRPATRPAPRTAAPRPAPRPAAPRSAAPRPAASRPLPGPQTPAQRPLGPFTRPSPAKPAGPGSRGGGRTKGRP